MYSERVASVLRAVGYTLLVIMIPLFLYGVWDHLLPREGIALGLIVFVILNRKRLV